MRTRAPRHGTAIALAIAWSAAPARAGGFYVPDVGARAVGLGAAVVADGADPSAIFHNPANLSGAAGDQVELAGGLFFPHVTFFRRPQTDPNTGASLRFDRVDNENPVVAAPYAAASHALGRGVVAGIAVDAPFGATLDYPADGAQRQVVTSIALRTIAVSPAIAVALPRGLSIGLAADLVYADLALVQRNALPYVIGDPEQYPDPDPALEGWTRIGGRDPFTAGATLGVGWRTADGRVAIGASARSPMALHLDGDARVENAAIAPLLDDQGAVVQAAGARTDQVRVALPLPLIARLGVAVRPSRRWRAEVDVNWQRWSTFRRLEVDFVHEYELMPTPGAYLYDVRVENAWRDTWSVRAGVEATPWRRPIALRAGVVYDASPIDDRHFGLLTPDSDKLGGSLGGRWSRPLGGGRLDLELAAVHLFLRERDVAPAADGTPGSDGTILNKPAPSFFHGVTRAGFDIVTLAVAWRY